jgi:ketosteroid isomerase-like protein
MKKYRVLIFLRPGGLKMSDLDLIGEYTAVFEKALHDGDGDTCAALCVENAVLLPPEEAPVIGKAAIGRHFANLGADPSVRLETINLEISGDLAFQQTRVSWDGDGGARHTDSIEVMQRQADGNWRCLASAWNSAAGFKSQG